MKCWMCGKEISYSKSNVRQYCKECGDKRSEELKHDKELYAILKKKVMFERAMELMEKQGCKMGKYRSAAIVVQKYLYANPDKFDSADEIVAAIVLIKNGLQIKTQAGKGHNSIKGVQAYSKDWLNAERLLIQWAMPICLLFLI